MTGETLRATVNQLFDVITTRSTSVELVFLCPEPSCGDSTGNRSVNLINGKTSCWRCNKGGKFVAWARRLGYPIEAQKMMAAPITDEDLSMYVSDKDPTPAVVSVPLPDGFIRCSDEPDSVYTELIAEMAHRKNLEIEDFYEAGVGFTQQSRRWEPYALFPVTEYGRVVYYQGRTYVDVPGETTKRFPTKSEAKWGARYWVYNIDEVRALKPKIVVMVESILNVLSLRKHMRTLGAYGQIVPVAVFKHNASKHQVQKILQMRSVKELCLLYDHDASERSWDTSPFMSDKIRVSVAEMPLGPGGKKTDPNDDAALGWQAFLERRQYAAAVAVSRLAENIKQSTRSRTVIPSAGDKNFDVLGMSESILDSIDVRRKRSAV